jgi:hypothetical protein
MRGEVHSRVFNYHEANNVPTSTTLELHIPMLGSAHKYIFKRNCTAKMLIDKLFNYACDVPICEKGTTMLASLLPSMWKWKWTWWLFTTRTNLSVAINLDTFQLRRPRILQAGAISSSHILYPPRKIKWMFINPREVLSVVVKQF